MFRWPLALTPLSLGSAGTSRDALLEITPRGAVFTLAALSHVGHPAHFAVVDAYLKGQMRVSPSAGIGEDSRLVVSALAAPLVAAHEFGIERLTLSDLILLPPENLTPHPPLRRGEGEQMRPGEDGLTRAPASPRFLLRVAGSPESGAPDRWLWVRAAERFETAGCTGTPHPGRGSRWHDMIVELPTRWLAGASASRSEAAGLTQPPSVSTLPPIEAELREPTEMVAPATALVDALRAVGLARFGRAANGVRTAADIAIRQIESAATLAPPLAAVDLQAERRGTLPGITLQAASDPLALATALAGPIARRQPTETTVEYRGQTLGVSLTPDLDGYQTLCLLPPADTAPAAAFEFMRDAAWDIIEALLGRPLAEHRTEPIALRLVPEDGHATVLDVGASVVVVRNQTVFTAWVGSDGRVMLKLFPAGGMGTGG